MLFSSYPFLFIFLPLALLGFFAAARLGPLAARLWVCAVSLLFYGWWHPQGLILLGCSICFNYGISTQLHGDTATARRQSMLLMIAIVANLLLLIYYKYLFPFLDVLYRQGWLSTDAGSIALPIGISFFTFTQIGYLVDCRQGLVKERGFLEYFLFVSFFPHLIAGPILHHREVMPQFADPENFRPRAGNLAVGFTLFAVGLFKKVLLADAIAPWVDWGNAHLQHIDLLTGWSVAVAYSMQLYFDFSGYSDMAIGLGFLFAVRMPLNFNSPYKALSIIDFWQRWHITLTRYVTLLIYNPLSLHIARQRQRAGLPVNRRALASVPVFAGMIALPTMITTLIAGVWHAAGLQFVAYGVLHGLYLCVNHFWRVFRKPLQGSSTEPRTNLWSVGWRWLLTYTSVLVAMVLFFAHSLSDAALLLKGMVGMNGSGFPVVPNVAVHWLYVGVLMGIAFGLPNIYQFLGSWSPALTAVGSLKFPSLAWRPALRYAVVFGLLLGVAALASEHTIRFLYFQF
jgi:alginate O-acetyltransferase complex protein AlgI